MHNDVMTIWLEEGKKWKSDMSGDDVNKRQDRGGVGFGIREE